MKHSPLFFVLLLLAGCGGRDDKGEPVAGHPDANRIAQVATQEEVVTDSQSSVRLEPLAPADLEAAGLSGAGCAFRAGDSLLLAATPGDAVVKIGGQVRHLAQSAPLDATGAFFEDRQLSLSVGRDQSAAGTGDDAGNWPARLTVTNRRAEVEQRIPGAWACAA